jgi:hypothetical protein
VCQGEEGRGGGEYFILILFVCVCLFDSIERKLGVFIQVFAE